MLAVLVTLSILLTACSTDPAGETHPPLAAQPTATLTAQTAITPTAVVAQSPRTAATLARPPAPTSIPRETAANTATISAATTATPRPTATAQPTSAPEPTSVAATQPAHTATPGATPRSDEAETLYVNTARLGYEGANLRETPSLQAPVVLVIRNGEGVQTVGGPTEDSTGKGWYEVSYRAKRGYVLASLLSTKPPDAAATQPPAQDRESVAAFFPVAPGSEAATRSRLAQLLPSQRETEHFTAHYAPRSFAASRIRTFERDTESALSYVERLLDAQVKGRNDYYLSPAFFPPPDPGLRGFNRCYDRMTFQLYDGSGTRLERQYIAAHEMTHQAACDSIGNGANTMLVEGLAMYASQRYLIRDGHVSLDGIARAALDEGKLLPLTKLSDGSIRYMGRLYYRLPYDEGGSFVQYLARSYGLPKLKQVYTSGDYTSVYGKGLEELEAEWIRYLRSDQAIGPFAPEPGEYLEDLDAIRDAYVRFFGVLGKGERVSQKAYDALDDARIAADRADSARVTTKLREFEQLMVASPRP